MNKFILIFDFNNFFLYFFFKMYIFENWFINIFTYTTLISFIIILIIDLIKFFFIEVNDSILFNIKDDYKGLPMINIINSIDDIGLCPLGYNNLKFGYFPGSYNYCNCSNKIKKGNCNYFDKLFDCKDIEKINSKYLLKLENSSFCYKAFNLLNYTDILIKYGTNKSNCPNDTKQCGILDYFNNKLCVFKNQSCPINKIIIDNNENGPLINKEKYKFQTVKFKNSKQYLHYTNEAINDNIITSFIIQKKYDLNSLFKPEIELNDKTLNKYNIIYKIQKNNLYEQNKIKFITNDNTFNNITIYSKNYFGINLNCLNDKSELFNFYNIISQSKIDQIKLNEKHSNKNDLICFIIILFECLIYYIYRKKLKEIINDYKKKEKNPYIKFCFFFTFIFIILKFVCIFLQDKNFKIWKNINISNQCSNNEINNYISDEKNKIEFYKIYYFLCYGILIFIQIGYIYDLITERIIYKQFKKKKKKENSTELKEYLI